MSLSQPMNLVYPDSNEEMDKKELITYVTIHKDLEDFHPTVLLPEEILSDIDHLKILNTIKINEHDYCNPIVLKGSKVYMQTPILKSMFGLYPYHTPGQVRRKWSIHVSLTNQNDAQNMFLQTLQAIDVWAEKQCTPEDCKFHSPIRYNYKNTNLPPVFRIKINNTLQYEDYLNCDIFQNGEIITDPAVDEFSALVTHNTLVRCVLELNPIWCAGKKYGTSYRLVQIELPSPSAKSMFRTSDIYKPKPTSK